MYELETIKREREKISDFFSFKCVGAKEKFRPIIWDDHHLGLVSRVLDEKSGSRQINIDLLEGSEPYKVDGFIKKTGIDFENELLALFYDPNRYDSKKLWDIYFAWIHKATSKEEIEEMISQL